MAAVLAAILGVAAGAGSGPADAPSVANCRLPGLTLNQPQGVAVDSSGDLYISDFSDAVVDMVTPTCVETRVAGIRNLG